MLFTKSQQQATIDALELANITYSDIQFFQNGRVSIYQEITNEETLFLAECGIFASLKQDAITIWDTLGTTSNNNDEDIEFFIVYVEGVPFAKFTIFPDLERVEYNSVVHNTPRSNWDTDRSELLLEVGIEIEEIEKSENVTEQIKEIVIMAIRLHFVGRDQKQAKRRFMKDLLSLVPNYIFKE